MNLIYNKSVKIIISTVVLFLISSSIFAQNINKDELLNDVKIISSDEMEGRKAGTEGNQKARNYIIKRFIEAGAEKVGTNFSQPFVFKTRDGSEITGTNIVAKVEGKTDAQIVISAHYDHLGIRGDDLYNGADDDASGTAALIQFIQYFSENTPNHTLIFVAFDAEEMGLQGARYFVDNYKEIDKVKMNINMDMISISDKDELYASGTYHYPAFKPIIEGIETGDITLLFGHDDPDSDLDNWTFASDHGAFHRKEIPFIYFGVEDHPHYHQPTDIYENITHDFYAKATGLILKIADAFDKQSDL